MKKFFASPSAGDLRITTGPAVPSLALIALRPLAAIAIAALWGAPAWLLVVSAALAVAATAAWAPLVALAGGAFLGFLPERYSGDAAVLDGGWWAAVAGIIVLAHVLLLSARLTERVGPRARVEWEAIGSLAVRALPLQVLAQAAWAIVWALPGIVSTPPVLLVIGAAGLLVLGVTLVKPRP